MKICIIGSGLSGLSAAYHIPENVDIHIFEKDTVLGGCLSSYLINDYNIERFYHHCFSGDRHLVQMVGELGLSGKMEWLNGSTGFCVDGEIFALTTPREILAYPHLTLSDKARLALLTLRSRSYRMEDLDETTAREFIEHTCGTHLYESFFEPLLRSKFGDMAESVSAAWLLSRIAIRSDRGVEGERLGYLNGGYQTLINAIEKVLENKGCTLHIGTPVDEIRREADRWKVNGDLFDSIISTIPPADLARISGITMPSITYQGAACMTIGLDREVTNGIYWVNMKDRAPYGAVIGHTNFIPFERYGEHIVYLASYFQDQLPKDAEKVMLEDFKTRFCVADGEIHWHRLAVEPAAGPVYTTGFRSKILPSEMKGMYLAGMFSRSNYPERSMEGSIVAGKAAAHRICEGERHD